MEELLYTNGDEKDKKDYFENIITTIIEIGQASEFVSAVCELIKWAAVDHLHLVGFEADCVLPSDLVHCKNFKEITTF